ncbi:MAG: hypothetical protein IPG17_03865 [Sandaracinaceae bacterium]|nr:hypothetical protein [Sandaracinaceae bacterium]
MRRAEAHELAVARDGLGVGLRLELAVGDAQLGQGGEAAEAELGADGREQRLALDAVAVAELGQRLFVRGARGVCAVAAAALLALQRDLAGRAGAAPGACGEHADRAEREEGQKTERQSHVGFVAPQGISYKPRRGQLRGRW